MENKINIDKIYIPSNDVVAREIEGELIIVPISAGIGDMEDELYTMNNMGKIIWKMLDGKKNLKKISKELCKEFESPPEKIEKDVKGFVNELLKRSMVVEI